MSSEIKVDTISENSSANGVAIDSVILKDGAVDVQGVADGIILDADNDTTISSDTDDRIDFKAGGSDIVHIFGNGNVSIGTTDDNAKLQIRKADSSVSPNSDADELFIENNGNTGITIGSSTTGTGNIHFGDSGDNDRALISYSHNTDHMTITHEGDESIVMGGGRLQTGGETSGDVDAGGLTLDQNAGDNFILTMKSSDVAHGMTDSVETDSFFAMGKRQSAGGALMYAMNSELQALRIIAAAGAENTTKGTTGNGPFVAYCTTKSGSGFGSVGSNGNMFIVSNNGNTKFIVDAEGDIHADGSLSAYDNYDDAQLVRAYDLSHGKGVIDSKFDKFVSYNHEKLADMKLVGREEDGTPNHFINVTGMQRLHNGAIWQQYEKHQKLANAVYELAKAAVGEDKANEILEQNDIKLLK